MLMNVEEKRVEDKVNSKRQGGKCPVCGFKMMPEGGCFICLACGYSPCA